MANYQLLVIGGGAAGMAAALSAEEAGLERVLLVERSDRLGGILPQCIHNGFGSSYFGEDLTGPEYARRFIERIKSSNIHVLLDTTVLQLSKDKTVLLSGRNGLKVISFDNMILATGSRELPIGALPIYGTRPAGIFTAGAAQKMVNLYGYDIGNEIVILGSGDIGLIMARRLTLLGKRVIAVIEQKPALGGLPRNQNNCIKAYHIPVMTSSTIDAVHGNGRISGVTVRHTDTETTEYIPCDTLLTAVGLIPERELLEGLISGNQIPDWVFLCGNCDYVHQIVDSVTFQAEKVGRQAITVLLRGVVHVKNSLGADSQINPC